MKRSLRSALKTASTGSSFRATVRSRCWSRARYTTPMPPSPSSRGRDSARQSRWASRKKSGGDCNPGQAPTRESWSASRVAAEYANHGCLHDEHDKTQAAATRWTGQHVFASASIREGAKQTMTADPLEGRLRRGPDEGLRRWLDAHSPESVIGVGERRLGSKRAQPPPPMPC